MYISSGGAGFHNTLGINTASLNRAEGSSVDAGSGDSYRANGELIFS